MNLNDMYSTLPKSLTMELAVKTKVELTLLKAIVLKTTNNDSKKFPSR